MRARSLAAAALTGTILCSGLAMPGAVPASAGKPVAPPKPKSVASPAPTASASASPAPSATPTPTSTPTAALVGPRSSYLALGDSLAFGQQLDGTYAQGSTDVFSRHLQTRVAGQPQVNLGCPGETTATLVDGGCPYQQDTRTGYTGRTQLAEALDQLARHPGQVSPVTLQVGMNDALPMVDPRVVDASGACLVHDAAAALTAYERDLTRLVGQLQSGLRGTGDLLLLNLYDPYEARCPNTGAVFDAFNSRLAAVAAAHALRVVDVRAAVRGRTCDYTGYALGCPGVTSPTTDLHPNTDGYQAIGDAVIARYGS